MPSIRSATIADDPPRLCSDDELAYRRSRTALSPDRGLELDRAYRLAHLPLVAPDHAAVIRAKAGTPYLLGRHDEVFSLVLPVPAEALLASDAYQELLQELEAAPFARKIAWDLLAQRQAKLHATICGALGRGTPPSPSRSQRRRLAALGPVEVELRGLFSGNVNVGRLYLRLYPERRGGRNLCHRIQEILERPPTDMYPVGMFNLTDHLDPGEAAVLAAVLERFWDRPLLRYAADHLGLLGAFADLGLASRIVERLQLTR
jgi:hypothetical protein